MCVHVFVYICMCGRVIYVVRCADVLSSIEQSRLESLGDRERERDKEREGKKER